MRQLRHPATIIAIVALFFSVTGGAVAALVVTGKSVRNGSLTGADLKDGSVGVRDLAAAARPRAGVTGPAGAAGLAGAPGSRGEVGPAGADGQPGEAGPRGSAGATGRDGATGRGTTGPTGPSGATGTSGTTGAPVAFGQVESDGTLAGPNSGVTAADLRQVAAGVWCIKGVPRGWRSIVVTADNSDGFNDTVASGFVESGSNIGQCDLTAGENIRVRTYDISDGALVDRPFLFQLTG